jgi:hypothetical protein
MLLKLRSAYRSPNSVTAAAFVAVATLPTSSVIDTADTNSRASYNTRTSVHGRVADGMVQFEVADRARVANQ